MLSLDYPTSTSKHDIEYYVHEHNNQLMTYEDTANTNNQLPYWATTGFNHPMELWANGYEQGLFPLLPPQQSYDDPSISTSASASDTSSVVQSPCFVISSPSASTFSSMTNTNACTSNDAKATSITPLATLQQWSQEALIERVLALEQELVFYHSSESPKQDGWQCRWDSCDTVTSTLEQLTDHLYRVHVGRGKASYYCGWTGCARHDKPFTKRHKMHNHLRTHTGERPFVCRTPGCHKRFSRPDSLSTHQKTHSNVRPFVCTDCGKSYFHARSLRKHLKASHHTQPLQAMTLLG